MIQKRRKKKRKIPRKFLIRRFIFILTTLILIVLLGAMIFNLLYLNNKRSYRNKYNKYLNQQELEEAKKSLKINDIKYEWKGELNNGNNPRRLIIHHSASKDLTPEAIHKMHIDKGWTGIGYHFYIKKNGKIYRGRDENIIGAHAKGSNKDTLGICLEGNFEEEEIDDIQKQALINLSTYLSLKYDISNILGHRDVYKTLCPGEKFPFKEVKESIIKNIKNI